jgi:multidrug efflux pump
VRLVYGGAAAEAGEANSALFHSLPIGILLLLVFLLYQFNSFRLLGIVLVTVPLAVVGVTPGLLLAQPAVQLHGHSRRRRAGRASSSTMRSC